MSELEYPREWFLADRWRSQPRAQLFDRETEHTLLYSSHGRERREKKVNKSSRWYPTMEEAVAALVDIKAREDERRSLLNARAAGPELLSALQGLVSALAANDEDGLTEFADVMVAARAAIAKATGAA
jgi:hypothetical protein